MSDQKTAIEEFLESRCAGKRSTWPRKGEQCCNKGKYIDNDGNKWCKLHTSIDKPVEKIGK